jgi:hypothetical protein
LHDLGVQALQVENSGAEAKLSRLNGLLHEQRFSIAPIPNCNEAPYGGGRRDLLVLREVSRCAFSHGGSDGSGCTLRPAEHRRRQPRGGHQLANRAAPGQCGPGQSRGAAARLRRLSAPSPLAAVGGGRPRGHGRAPGAEEISGRSPGSGGSDGSQRRGTLGAVRPLARA